MEPNPRYEIACSECGWKGMDCQAIEADLLGINLLCPQCGGDTLYGLDKESESDYP